MGSLRKQRKKALADIDDLVEALQESLNVISLQRSKNQIENTQIKTKGAIVSKFVACGKNCNGCPHGPYLYKVSRVNGKQVWEYLGRANETNDSDPSQKRYRKRRNKTLVTEDDTHKKKRLAASQDIRTLTARWSTLSWFRLKIKITIQQPLRPQKRLNS